MSRICVIDIAGLSKRLVDNNSQLWLGSLGIQSVRATFPCVVPSIQASMTTGRLPGAHGIVSGGLFRRQSHAMSFWERSNTELTKKRFWHAREIKPSPKVSLVFWTNSLAGASDIVLGVTSYSCRCGRINHQPLGLYENVAEHLGQFNCSMFHGPEAYYGVSSWICQAAEFVWKKHTPDLQLVHLPGVDIAAQRHGINSKEVSAALAKIDKYAHKLAKAVISGGGQVVITSSGGYVDVTGVCHPNIALEKAGLLKTKQTGEGLLVDFENSRAVAMTDHQIAHIYCDDEDIADQAVKVISSLDGVEKVCERSEVFCQGLGHDRAGEYVAIAKPDQWFSYRWWGGDTEPPRLAYNGGAEGKCGYDPCELFEGLDESKVRASRGRTDIDIADQCLFGATCDVQISQDPCVTDIPSLLKQIMCF